MARIAVGGFQHETNTFAPSRADFAAFAETDSWPGLVAGERLFDAVAGLNLAVSGFIEAAREAGHEIVPLLWCAATPSGPVTREAYERIAGMLIAGLDEDPGVDAVYLDLHGAMVTEHLDDGEGELLGRIRERIGAKPLVASLDFHANVSRAMVARASGLVAYRTYPHTDIAETGARAAMLLERILGSGAGPARCLCRLPFLIPVTSQCTLTEPAAGLVAAAAAAEGGPVWSVSFAPGFPLADVPASSPTVFGWGADREAVEKAVGAVARLAREREADFAGRLWAPDEAVRHALSRPRRRPVVLADTQDNPGAGGTSDTTGLLEALVRHDAPDAVLALLCDSEAAAAARAAGEGAHLRLALGGKAGPAGHGPFEGRFRVEKLASGRFTATGPVWRGSRMDLGPTALLRLAMRPGSGVRVIVSSRRFQAGDQALFHHVGIDPAKVGILALKSSVHFRADFGPLAEEVLVVLAPGPSPADTTALPYRRLPAGLRLAPLGPPYAPAPAGLVRGT